MSVAQDKPVEGTNSFHLMDVILKCPSCESRLPVAVEESAASPAHSASHSGLERQLSQRHRQALDQALEELHQARALLGEGAGLDLVAEALRGATLALDRITGQTTPEDLLDRIFARFCLGK